MSSLVYWLHTKDHKDIFTEGYVGITNNLKARLRNHKSKKYNAHLRNAINKYGWDNIIKEVILVADDLYCLMIESQLRNKDNIGWNIVKGGGKPPVSLWNKGVPCLEKVKEAVRKANTGRPNPNKGKRIQISDETRNAIIKAHKGRIKSPEEINKIRQKSIGRKYPKVTCPYCNKLGGIIPMKRWHMNNCKFKGVSL